MTTMNRQITLASRPRGVPDETNFQMIDVPIAKHSEGELLLRTLYLSVDPYMRGRMNDGPSYAAPVEIGAVMVGGTVGQVVASNDPGFAQGDIVESYSGWQEYAVVPARGARKIDPTLAPISTALGVLGMPGLSAYFGLLEIAHPKAGETVFVSGAAGAVGSVAGQIAAINGCRVTGSAGSDEKVRYLTEDLGFDAAFNYKTAQKLRTALRESAPKGIDVYFDNVGGEITDAVMFCMNTRARISVCGHISQYNNTKVETGPRLLGLLITKQARMEGFLVFQFEDRYTEGLTQLAQWVTEGKLKYRETITDGIENAPTAFLGMLQGENIGKQLVKVADV